MKPRMPSTLLACLALTCSAPLVLASDVQDRFRAEGKQMDLTRFLNSNQDAYSQSYPFGQPQTHTFTVKQGGVFEINGQMMAQGSQQYTLEASLLNDEGEEITHQEANGQTGGLKFKQHLDPGTYTLKVNGQFFGSQAKNRARYYVNVLGMDAQGRERPDAIADSQPLRKTDPNQTTALVHDPEQVTRLGRKTATTPSSEPKAAPSETTAPHITAPQPETTQTAPQADSDTKAETPQTPASTTTATDSPQKHSSQDDDVQELATQEPRLEAETVQEEIAQEETTPDVAAPHTFETLVTSLNIRTDGLVMSFELADPMQVHISSSSFFNGQGTYRIEAEVRNAQGEVVAQDSGEGFDGDVDFSPQLPAGQYQIFVKGQKFGSSHSGSNNYELKLEAVDPQ